MVVDVQQRQANGGIRIATAASQYDGQQACAQDRFDEISFFQRSELFHGLCVRIKLP